MPVLGKLYINNFAEPKTWLGLKMNDCVSALEALTAVALWIWIKNTGVEELDIPRPVPHPTGCSKTSQIYL